MALFEAAMRAVVEYWAAPSAVAALAAAMIAATVVLATAEAAEAIVQVVVEVSLAGLPVAASMLVAAGVATDVRSTCAPCSMARTAEFDFSVELAHLT